MKLLSAAAVRRCLIADPGYVMFSADFDQIEMRVAAAFAGETVLIEAAKRGESLHKAAAIRLWGPDYTPDQYRYTKNVNFGWLYGGGAYTLSRQAGITLEVATAIIKQYQEQFKALTAYKRRETEMVLRSALSVNEYKALKILRSRMFEVRDDTAEGKQLRYALKLQISRLCYGKIGWVRTHYGRHLPVDAEKAYAVVNYKVQCTAGDLLKEAFLDVMNDPELEPTVLLPVHDELLGQAPIDKAEYIAGRYGEVMSREFLGVPITASGKVYGKSWGHGYLRKD
jgi:DNA polymerase-1